MDIAFYCMGILSLLYYVAVVAYTRNWRATFSWFWLFLSVFWVEFGRVITRIPHWGVVVFQVVCGALFLIFAAVEVIILSGMLTMQKKGLPYIIVLGACVREGEITGSLKRRLDKALAYLNENPETTAVLSGGQGKGENMTEALAMKKYLLQCGVEEERLVLEEKSHSTKENLENSLTYIKDADKAVGIVTNNFHMYRAVKLAKYIGYRNVRSITAGSDIVLFLNYMVREFFAVLYMYVKFGRKTKEEPIDK